MKFYTLFLFCFINVSFSQNLSGLWVHKYEDYEYSMEDIYAIMYIKEDANGNIEGYTYDEHNGDWCSFYLEGSYDTDKKRLKAVNTTKIKPAFLHSRARFKLFYEANGNEEFLTGNAMQRGVHGFILSFGIGIPLRYRRINPDNWEDVKGYDRLKPLIETLDKKTSIESEVYKINSDDEVVKSQDTNNIEINDFVTSVKARKNEVIQTHRSISKTITIEVMDNNREDGDRISIFLNDELITYNLEVTKSTNTIEITLPDDESTHQILFVANNMGEIPPNTTKIRYTIDGISYEEIIFTNLRENKFLKIISN